MKINRVWEIRKGDQEKNNDSTVHHDNTTIIVLRDKPEDYNESNKTLCLVDTIRPYMEQRHNVFLFYTCRQL